MAESSAPLVTIHGQQRRLDWKKDPRPSDKDWKLEDRIKLRYGAPVPEPDVVNLTAKEPPIRDQGRLGSCTGFSWASLYDYAWWNKPVSPIRLTFSPQFIYWNERELEGTISEDAGAYIKDGAKVLSEEGCCLERTWPYYDTIEAMIPKPSTTAFQEALRYRSRGYWRMLTLSSMFQNLALGHPFTFGMMLYESFDSETVMRTGVVPMPGTREAVLGGHAVSAVGYSKPHKLFICRNQWGWRWGVKGHFYLHFDYMANPNLTEDRWTVRI